MLEVIIASDYKGIELKREILKNDQLLAEISFTDIVINESSKLDYVDISKNLADFLLFNEQAIAIIICANVEGVAIALNRFTHVRAAICNNLTDAINAKEKLNANILCLAYEYLDIEIVKQMILAFSKAQFHSEKHGECVKKLAVNQTEHQKNGVNLIVRAIIIHDKHILLTTPTFDNKNFAQGLFFLPGGHVEHSEPSLQALKREILEEMNLTCKNEQFVGALECSWDRKGNLYHEIDLIYKVQIDNLDLNQPPLAVDHKFHRFIWKKIDELENLTILPHSLKKIIASAETNPGRFFSEMLKK